MKKLNERAPGIVGTLLGILFIPMVGLLVLVALQLMDYFWPGSASALARALLPYLHT